MAEAPKSPSLSAAEGGFADSAERIPFWQRVLDNPFLLLFIGVAVPTIVYIIWGIMELVQVPVAAP